MGYVMGTPDKWFQQVFEWPLMTASHKTDVAMTIIQPLALIQAQVTDFEDNSEISLVLTANFVVFLEKG